MPLTNCLAIKRGGGRIKRPFWSALLLITIMVMCTVPAFWSTNNPDALMKSKIEKDDPDIPKISAASKLKTLKKSRKTVKKKTAAKRVVKKKVKAKMYKVKVRYFYKGKWRTRYVYRPYSPPIYRPPAPAPPQIRDIPPWECTGPSNNCPSDDPRIVSLARSISVPENETIANPEPAPKAPDEVKNPATVENPGEDPKLETFSGNETAYNESYNSWKEKNTSYTNYLEDKKKHDQYVIDFADYSEKLKSYQPYITVEKLNTHSNAVRIFNWVRDNVEYSFYFNTARGAIGTLNDKRGNCVDQAHLLTALYRAVGIPTRYINADCTFSSGKRYGHVWAQVFINGQWIDADTSNEINDFGLIRNWNKGTMYLKGIFSSLPF